ncbi:MAG: HD domain-containing phosphohydrolase [Ornithinimicrobium sp.]
MRRKINDRVINHFVLALTVLVVVLLFVGNPSVPTSNSRETWIWLAVSFVVIVIADSRPITVVNGRKLLPVGMTVSIAMAMTIRLPGNEVVDVGAGYLALLAGLGASIAAGRRFMRYAEVPVLTDLATRVLVTAVVAFLVNVQWPGGWSLRIALIEWPSERQWILAIALGAVATTALSMQLALWSYQRAAREHTLLRHAMADEMKAAGATGLGVISAAVSTALATSAVGPFAVVMFVLPLVLLMVAVRGESTVLTGQRQTVWALSKLTDQGGFTDPGHAARVARLAVPIGRAVGLPEPSLRELEYAALLHDLGQLSLQRPIPGGATTHISALDQRRLAVAGASLLARTAELSEVSSVVAHHATPYWRLEQLGEIPLASRILRVANAYDDLVGVSLDGATRMRALQRLRLGMGHDYDPRVLRALCRVLMRDGQISKEDLLSLELWPARAAARA